MRRLACITAVFVLAGCAHSGPATQSVAGHGALSIAIVPNPIVAKPAGGGMYDFPFDIVLRETGGRPVKITSISLDVYAMGGAIHAGSESYDAARIAREGFATTIAANGEVRYHFAPRKSVPDERLFGGVTGEVRVEGTDDTAAATTARASVTVTR